MPKIPAIAMRPHSDRVGTVGGGCCELKKVQEPSSSSSQVAVMLFVSSSIVSLRQGPSQPVPCSVHSILSSIHPGGTSSVTVIVTPGSPAKSNAIDGKLGSLNINPDGPPVTEKSNPVSSAGDASFTISMLQET
jgi:hypothetical protein